jgi:hypothetical protein
LHPKLVGTRLVLQKPSLAARIWIMRLPNGTYLRFKGSRTIINL